MKISSTHKQQASASRQAEKFEIPWDSAKQVPVDLIPVESFARSWIEDARVVADRIEKPVGRQQIPDNDPSPDRVERKLGDHFIAVHEKKNGTVSYSKRSRENSSEAHWEDGNFIAGSQFRAPGRSAGPELKNRLTVEGDTLRVESNQIKLASPFSFEEDAPSGWHKKSEESVVWFGSQKDEHSKAERRIRRELAQLESHFEVDPSRDMDPRPNRYFDGTLSLDSTRPGIEVARLSKPGFQAEIRRENGSIVHLKERRSTPESVTERVVEIRNHAALEKNTSFTTQPPQSTQRDFGDILEVATAPLAAVGIGALAVALFTGLV